MANKLKLKPHGLVTATELGTRTHLFISQAFIEQAGSKLLIKNGQMKTISWSSTNDNP